MNEPQRHRGTGKNSDADQRGGDKGERPKATRELRGNGKRSFDAEGDRVGHRGAPKLGLLESAYEECLCWELTQAGLTVRRQVPLPIVYKAIKLDLGYRLDLVVENRLVVELKTVETLLPIHEAQLLTYLKLSGLRAGLLLNFNSAVLKDGIKRMVL